LYSPPERVITVNTLQSVVVVASRYKNDAVSINGEGKRTSRHILVLPKVLDAIVKRGKKEKKCRGRV
jgi:hypothetical protein